RAAGRCPRVLHRCADPGRPRRAFGPAAHQQPGEGRRAVRVRHRGGGPGGAAGHAHAGEPALPDRQAGPPRPPARRSSRPAGRGRGRGRSRRRGWCPGRAGAPGRRRGAGMSGAGRPGADPVDAAGLSLAIAATRWHAEITDSLVERAVAAAKACGVDDPTVVRVPGAVELAVVAAELAARHDAVACVGAVIRGGTPHFEYVCEAVTYGLARVALDARTPVGNGVLTCDTLEQARERCGLDGSTEDKGWEAVVAALDTAIVLRSLREPGARDGVPRGAGRPRH